MDELTPSWFIGIDWTGAQTRRRAAAERFELDVPIGRGGSAEVWQARDPTSAQRVAIKVLVREIARHPRFQSQLRHDVRAVARLDHPRIVRVLDVGTLGMSAERATEGRLVAGSPFVAMELLAGTLVPLIDQPRPWPVIRSIVERLLEALGHAHARGVVHLDVKPSNIMRRSVADDDIVLTDFGIAWIGHEPAPVSMGSPIYAAPEQLIGDGRDVGPATDLFALACVTWELLTGRPPFAGLDPDERVFASPGAFSPRVAVPDDLHAWLLSLLENAPRRRVASAREALRRIPGGFAEVTTFPADWRGGDTATRSESPLEFGLGLWELGAAPIVGRERERDQLWEATSRGIASAQPMAVDIVGPPGSGKSRLADWLLTRLAELDLATTLRIDGSTDLADALHRLFRTRGLSVERATQRIQSMVGSTWVAREAAVVLCGDNDDPTALHVLLEAMAEERALVLLCDGAPAPLVHGRILLVRTGDQPMDDGVEVRLGPLDDDERAQLLGGVLRLGAKPRAHLAQMQAWPGALLAVVATWAEAGKLERRGDEIVLTSSPDEIRDVWAERLDGLARRLAEAETRALEVAAVLGSGAELSVWSRAAALVETAPSLACLDRLAMEGLGEVRDGRIVFAREEIVAALLQRAGLRLPAIHRACAAALAMPSGIRRARERRGVHLYEAGEHGAAREVLLEGARARLRALDAAGAIALLEMRVAAGCEEGVRAWILRSACERRLGNVEAATELAKRAHRAARQSESADHLYQAAHQRARLARARGASTEAMRYLLEAKVAAQAMGDARSVADAIVDTASVLLWVGALERASKQLEEARDIDPRPEGRAMAWLLSARVARLQDRPQQGRRCIAEAEAALGAGPRGMLAEIWNEAAEIERAAGALAKAATLYRRALRGYVSLGSAAPTTELRLGLTLGALGDVEGAVASIEGALGAWKAQGRDELAGAWTLALAWLAALAGEWKRARHWLDQVRPLDDDDWRALHTSLEVLAVGQPEVLRTLSLKAQSAR